MNDDTTSTSADRIPEPYASGATATKSSPLPPPHKFKDMCRRLLRELWTSLKITDLEPEDSTVANIRSGVSFRGSQLLILIFAILVASLGLNTNSIPVIIGAMLISPLMGPIIGMGLALAISDYELLRRGLKNISLAVIGSVVASALFFLISPQYEGTSQLLARTSPSIYDVFIALFGGAAGIVSIAIRNKGQVMPGVAIATSLMPPLCTAGYGLATMQMNFFFGAFYLFFTNCLFILVASWIVVKILKFKPAVYANQRRARLVQRVVYIIITLTLGLSAYLTVIMIQKSVFVARAQDFVTKEMVFPNTQVLNSNEYIKDGKRHIDVNLIGEALNTDSLKLVMYKKLDEAGLGGTILTIHQGFAMDTGDAGAGTGMTRDVADLYDAMQKEISRRQDKIDSLSAVIKLRTDFSDEAPRIAPEVKAVFPDIRDIALASTVIANTSGDVAPDTVRIAFVNAPGGLTASQRSQLQRYIEARLSVTEVHVSVNPERYPWNPGQ